MQRRVFLFRSFFLFVCVCLCQKKAIVAQYSRLIVYNYLIEANEANHKMICRSQSKELLFELNTYIEFENAFFQNVSIFSRNLSESMMLSNFQVVNEIKFDIYLDSSIPYKIFKFRFFQKIVLKIKFILFMVKMQNSVRPISILTDFLPLLVDTTSL